RLMMRCQHDRAGVSMDLIGNLTALADQWEAAHHAAGQARVSRKTLGARALDDAKLFERLDAGGSLNVPRFERLVEFLSDVSNWPGRMPIEAERRLALLGKAPPGWRIVVERDVV